MKKGVVKFGDGSHINIRADRMFQDANFLYIYCGEEMVGMVSIGTFDAAWISEVPSEKVVKM